MRRVIAVTMSTFVVALMMCTPVSAKKSTVSFTDPVGDIGPDPYYNLPTDPNDQPTTSSPICTATYFDMVEGWVTLKNANEYILGFELAGVVNEDIVLPPGATGALWVWYFYSDTEYYADCMAVISWDGTAFEAYLKHRTEFGVVPYPYWNLEFAPSGSTVELTITTTQTEPFELLSEMNFWFAETKIWFSPLVEPYEDWALPPDYGGWYPVDINDWDPSESLLPWLPMP